MEGEAHGEGRERRTQPGEQGELVGFGKILLAQAHPAAAAGAGRRDSGRTGLAWAELRSSGATAPSTYEDPWGTAIRVVPGQPTSEGAGVQLKDRFS